MKSDEEARSVQVTDFCRTHFRKLGAEEFARMSARPEDFAIAADFSAVDLARHHAGNTQCAIAWLRGALDVMEAALPTPMETVQ